MWLVIVPFGRGKRWRRWKRQRKFASDTMKGGVVMHNADVLTSVSNVMVPTPRCSVQVVSHPHQVHLDPTAHLPTADHRQIQQDHITMDLDTSLPEIARYTDSGHKIVAQRSLKPASFKQGLHDHDDREFANRIVDYCTYGAPIGYDGDRIQMV
jgi:hypothetical protein